MLIKDRGCTCFRHTYYPTLILLPSSGSRISLTRDLWVTGIRMSLMATTLNLRLTVSAVVSLMPVPLRATFLVVRSYPTATFWAPTCTRSPEDVKRACNSLAVMLLLRVPRPCITCSFPAPAQQQQIPFPMRPPHCRSLPLPLQTGPAPLRDV